MCPQVRVCLWKVGMHLCLCIMCLWLSVISNPPVTGLNSSLVPFPSPLWQDVGACSGQAPTHMHTNAHVTVDHLVSLGQMHLKPHHRPLVSNYSKVLMEDKRGRSLQRPRTAVIRWNERLPWKTLKGSHSCPFEELIDLIFGGLSHRKNTWPLRCNEIKR